MIKADDWLPLDWARWFAAVALYELHCQARSIMPLDIDPEQGYIEGRTIYVLYDRQLIFKCVVPE